MNEQPIATFQKAIRATHGCESALQARVPIRLEFGGETAWEGEVLIFDLLDHPTAQLCYAWSYRTRAGRDRTVTVLHQGPVDSPRAAVRAAIITGSQE